MAPRNQQGKGKKALAQQDCKLGKKVVAGQGSSKGRNDDGLDPKLEKQASTPPKSPNLGGTFEEGAAPDSLDKRPRKKLEVRMGMAASNVHENLEPPVDVAQAPHGKEAISSIPLPYVEVKLPDGRLVRQCRASNVCPTSEAFIEKRVRMEEHLRKKHGLQVKIPKRVIGRPTNKQMASRPSRIFPHPNASSWKRQAEKRFHDKDRKFERNRLTYEHAQTLKAEQAWNDLEEVFRTGTKEDYIASWVKDAMTSYMSTAANRLAKIESRIAAHGHTKVSLHAPKRSL